MRPILLLLLLSLLLLLALFGLGGGRPTGALAPAVSAGARPPAGADSLAAELRARLDDSVAPAGYGARLGPAGRAP